MSPSKESEAFPLRNNALPHSSHSGKTVPMARQGLQLPQPAASPTLISTVHLVKVSDFSFCSSCFSYWTVASSYLNNYVNFLGFLLIWDSQHFIGSKSYLFSATAFPLRPSPYPHPPCPFPARAGCPAREAEPSSSVKQGRQERDGRAHGHSPTVPK